MTWRQWVMTLGFVLKKTFEMDMGGRSYEVENATETWLNVWRHCHINHMSQSHVWHVWKKDQQSNVIGRHCLPLRSWSVATVTSNPTSWMIVAETCGGLTTNEEWVKSFTDSRIAIIVATTNHVDTSGLSGWPPATNGPDPCEPVRATTTEDVR